MPRTCLFVLLAGSLGLSAPADLAAGEAYEAGISFYDRHVIFDNSDSVAGAYGTSGSVVEPSSLELIDGALPVDATRAVSPPNSLRLRWTSAFGGDWRAVIDTSRRYARPFSFEGNALVLRVFADTEITALNSPRLSLADVNGNGTPTVTLVSGDASIPAGEWVTITLPFDEMFGTVKGTSDSGFAVRDIAEVVFVQGLDDGESHTLLVDDIRIAEAGRADTKPPPAPSGLEAAPGERHFDLAWDPADAEHLLEYRIYRSTDGKTFDAIGTQPGHRARYVDFVGEPGTRAEYRVTALDLAGNESAASAVTKPGVTRAFSDDELMTMVQEASFRYYWDMGHPKAGLAPEVWPGDPNLLALGGSGFGVMALIVGAERGFEPREAVADRLLRIVRFLAGADRFHGVWPHFLNGDTGKPIALFGKYDNGGDLVETAFMIQGLLAARQYFDGDNTVEREIRDTVTRLWEEVEWDWYRKSPASDVLYWHWSPDYAWHINHPLIGWNETMIIYLLAIASPTHAVPATMYHTGWAGTSERHIQYRRNWSRTTAGDHYVNGNSYYGIELDVGEGNGAELFFTHFSFFGFDPRGLRDRYTNYYENNRAIALIHHAYSIENPRGHKGYGPDTWGLSAGINNGGGRPLPRDDNGTINVMASLASMPWTPEESMAALKHYYRDLGDRTWGVWGFHDGFNESQDWFEEVYMALNQAPVTVMIENHRTGLVWKHFMANPEIRPALDAIGFVPDP